MLRATPEQPEQPERRQVLDVSAVKPSTTALGSFIGKAVRNYEVVALIGRGGMGEVLKARDLRLDRIVAIKILRSELAQDAQQRERFEREARTVARLNHPHICTLFDIGRQDDIDYLVMEYIEGETLADRLLRGRLPFAQALRYAIDIADALDQAHRKGVTHRDIKPGNVMITRDGWLKILDFGLAKVTGEPGVEPSGEPLEPSSLIGTATQLTRPGTVAGTAPYMSPEQARGWEVDDRSDIFSFAVVLYEMTTGSRPFQRATEGATIEAILRDEPPPLRSVAPHAPAEIEQLLLKCLRKDPNERFQPMEAVRKELEEIRLGLDGNRANTAPSIAVLPFANLSADADNEYFSDGLTEELINALAQVPGLKVVSRSSTFQFKGKTHDVREVGRKLGVQTVLDGSVRKSGNRIRVTAQLGEVQGGCSVWSERFDRTLEDIFAVQDEVVRSILCTLMPRLGTSVPGPRARSGNLEAHGLYLKGRYCYNRQTPEAAAEALAYFEEAVALAPEHAMAHVGLADCHLLRGWYGLSLPHESMPKAREEALRALEIDDKLALAHCALALVHAGYEWRWREAQLQFARALELGAGFASIHFHYALDYLTPMGRLDEAIQEVCTAQELDPVALITRTALGGCLYRNRQYDAAIQQFQETLRMDAGFYHAHWSLARALERKYLFDDAVEEFRQANELAGGSHPLILGELGHCYGIMSRTEEARRALGELEEMSRRVYVSPFCHAFVHLGMGDRSAALGRLEEALEERSRALLWIGVDPRFQILRTEPRFRLLLQQMGLAAVGGG